MSTKAYVIALRNDIPAGALQMLDLKPNTSQRNFIYDGAGQTGYVRPALIPSHDFPVVQNLTPANGAASIVTDGAKSGLAAYLQDVVHADPGAGNTVLAPRQAWKAAQQICLAVMAGTSITATAINAILSAADVAGAATDLDGQTVGNSESFGSVEEVVKILAGFTYTVADNTIQGLQAGGGEWQSKAERQAAADADLTGTYSASGSFSSSQNIKTLYQGAALSNSMSSGVLSTLMSANFGISNSKVISGVQKVNYTYAVDEKEESSYTYSASAALASSLLIPTALDSATVQQPAVFTTAHNHGLVVGDLVWLVHHDGTLERQAGGGTGRFAVKTVNANNTFELEDANGDLDATAATDALSAGFVVLTDGTARYSIAKGSMSSGGSTVTGGVGAAICLIDEEGNILS